jgi:hypothetical protein
MTADEAILIMLIKEYLKYDYELDYETLIGLAYFSEESKRMIEDGKEKDRREASGGVCSLV